MTNTEGTYDTCNEEYGIEHRKAVIQAIHLVGEVLDEACVITALARDTEDPWGYLAHLKKIKNNNPNEAFCQNLTYTISKDQLNRNRNEDSPVITSTPQKGQGDEDFDSVSLGYFQNNEDIIKSTSMFINHLFDMSDLVDVEEYENIYDFKQEYSPESKCIHGSEENINGQSLCLNQVLGDISVKHSVSITRESTAVEAENNSDCHGDIMAEPENKFDRNSIAEDFHKIVESYVNNALCQVFVSGLEIKADEYEVYEGSTEYSSYSYLSDDFPLEEAYCMDVGYRDGKHEVANTLAHIKKEETTNEVQRAEERVKYSADDLCSYEDAYITLNRDFEQYLEDEPILQDSKISLSMQEIDLYPEQTNELLMRPGCETKSMDLPTTSKVSALASYRKNSLMRRCRTQGRRIFACVRWWWRRKLAPRHKIPRGSGTAGGMCSLTPDARRRASSVLDHIRDGASPQTRHWKFNTISGSLMHSSLWKELGLKMKLRKH